MSESLELENLIKAVDQIDPFTLTDKDIAEIKAWGADKVGFVLVHIKTQSIVYATEGAEKIFGYVTDEMVGLNLVALVPDEFQDVHPQHVEGFGKAMQIRSMGRRDKPLLGRERDGGTFPVEIGLFPRRFKGQDYCLANVVRLTKEV